MLKIILIRHGETVWNKEQLFRGRKDIELNRKGEKQAEYLTKYLGKIKVDDVYASPLKRALFMAKKIAVKHKLCVKISKALIDFDFGSWEGHTLEDIKVHYPQLYNLWLLNPEKLKIPKAETIAQLRNRLKQFVQALVKKRQNKTVVIISHRVVLKMFILSALDLPAKYFWSIKLDTSSISVLEYNKGNGTFVLSLLNDVSFLKNHETEKDF